MVRLFFGGLVCVACGASAAPRAAGMQSGTASAMDFCFLGSASLIYAAPSSPPATTSAITTIVTATTDTQQSSAEAAEVPLPPQWVPFEISTPAVAATPVAGEARRPTTSWTMRVLACLGQ